MKPNNSKIFFMIIIQLCITFIYLAPLLILLYFAINQISNEIFNHMQKMQHIQNMQNISNDFEIFNRLDSGIYG